MADTGGWGAGAIDGGADTGGCAADTRVGGAASGAVDTEGTDCIEEDDVELVTVIVEGNVDTAAGLLGFCVRS